MITHPTYTDVEETARCILMSVALLDVKPTTIVAPARGGLLLGVILSHNLGIPVQAVAYSSKSGCGDKQHTNVLPEISGEVILLVDDIADTAHSIREITEHYGSTNHVVSAVMYYKEGAVCKPDIVHHTIPADAPFIYFPWESKLQLGVIPPRIPTLPQTAPPTSGVDTPDSVARRQLWEAQVLSSEDTAF